MSGRVLPLAPLTAEAFAAFGDVLEAAGPSHPINGGSTDRFHDRARTEALGGRLGISLALGRPSPLPLALLERHPLGSQAWMPLDGAPFLVVVAEAGADGAPGRPLAFRTAPGQGVNYLRGTWHAPLIVLDRPQRFLVVDRIGPGGNLEEHRFEAPWTIGA